MRGARLGFTTAGIVLSFAVARVGLAQDSETVVSKDAISVHRVERGTMTLRENVTGAISSLDPARATMRLTPEQSAIVRAGQACSMQVVAPAILHCAVAQVRRDSATGVSIADVDVTGQFPPGTTIDDRIGALVDVGTTENVVYFERPSSARAATRSTIFLIEPDGVHARRVPVVYGRISGSQLEIVSGLAPGDRVIVTDLPEAAGRDRVILR